MRGLGRYIEDLLRHRRPHRFRAGAEDEAVLRTAITLRAARPGSGVPREEFVTGLAARLAGELDPAAGPAPARPRGASRGSSCRVRRSLRLLPRWAPASITSSSRVAADRRTRARRSSRTPARGAPSRPARSSLRTRYVPSTSAPSSASSPAPAARFARCPGYYHQSCRLALEAATRQLTCPCHNAAFALTGQVVRHELRAAPKPLPHLLAREVDGAVQVFAAGRPLVRSSLATSAPATSRRRHVRSVTTRPI